MCVFVCAPLSSTLALLLFPKLYPAHDIFFLPSYKKANLEMNKEGLALFACWMRGQNPETRQSFKNRSNDILSLVPQESIS